MTADREQLLAADAEARELAQSKFDRPLLVEAGAGTGKTALLAARVVAWCVGEGWDRHTDPYSGPEVVARRVIERVVAITFTEAAAAEMAQRVGSAFSCIAWGDPPEWIDFGSAPLEESERLRLRCTLLADEVHRLPAQTIHSFCHRLLRAFPLEGRLHPSFEVDGDGSLVEAATSEVVEEALRGLARGAEGADWERLAEAGVAPPQVSEALGELVRAGVTSDDLDADPFPEKLARQWLEELRAGLVGFEAAEGGALADLSERYVAPRVRAALVGLARRLDEMASLGEGVTATAVADAASTAAMISADRLRRWADGDLASNERRALGEREADLVAAAGPLADLLERLRGVRPAELGAARRLLQGMLGDLEARLRRRGVVTYDGLLRGARRALARFERVRREVRSGIDQLLVDEFQDTDDVQCEIVRWLALDGPKARRPGLFIVGDPKQSIYGWRSADLGAYHDFKRLVEREGGIVKPLVRNFRSVRAILDEVEEVVEDVMVEEDGVQPPFQPLEATGTRCTASGFLKDGWTPVEFWVAWPFDPESGVYDAQVTANRAVEVEANALAADIRRLHDERDVRWGRIGVLLRTTTVQEAILERFRALDIPFEVARERDYYRQREVVEAAALVRCVLEPADQLALLTVLRSDAVGVPDAALVPLWRSGVAAAMADLAGPDEGALADLATRIARAAAAVDHDVPGAAALPRWPAALESAAAVIADLRVAALREPPDRFVERMRALWLAEVTAAGRYLGRFRRARLDRFYDELTEALGTGDGSLAGVARFLRRAVEEGRESQLPAEPDLSADAVHVMTVHGAKGLDFEHVYLVQIHRGEGRGPRRPAAEVVRYRGELAYRLFGWPTLGWAAAAARRHLRERAERVRLLYVAMTRAKERLVVSGRWRSDNDLVAAAEAASFADLVAHRAEATALAEQAMSAIPRRPEAGGLVQWRLPDPGTERDGTIEAEGEVPEWLSEGRAVADARRLEELRSVAHEREALPLAATVTGLVHRALEPTGPADEEPPGGEREAVMAVGVEVHRLLEILDLESDLSDQVRRRAPELAERLGRTVAGPERDRARERLGELVERIAAGDCLGRLQELAGEVVSRELPLLLPPMPDDPVLGAVVGAADLVYRDGGRLVVADYKTDRVDDGPELAARVAAYRPQLERYAAALEQALDLPGPPLTELWFLHADRIVRLEPSPASSSS